MLGATRVGELMELTADLQQPPPEVFAELGPQAPRWRRTYGPALIVLGVALGLAGVEGLTQLGGGNEGIEDASAGGGIGFPALKFPGQPAVHTRRGPDGLRRRRPDEFGTSETLRAVIYPNYVVLWMPQAADPTRVDTFLRRQLRPRRPRPARGTRRQSRSSTWPRSTAKRWLGWSGSPGGGWRRRSADDLRRCRPRFDVVGALMSVYVSDAYVSGRVEADLDGHRDGGVRGELSAATARPRRPSGSRPAGRTHRGLPHPST